MPQYVMVRNNTSTPPRTTKMESAAAEAWVRRHDDDPRTKGQYEILAPAKIVVNAKDEKKNPVVNK